MFEVSVATSFHAIHAVTIAGVEETPHEHDWKVVASVQGDKLDEDGLLVDFLDLQRRLEEIVAPFLHADLNQCPEMDGQNPTAEHVAWYIAKQLQENVIAPTILSSVRVTEAPNCIATYRP